MPKSTVIIPVFNNAALTAQCLGELVKQKIANIVVVDDCSSDSTPDMLAGFGKKIRVVAHRENCGFAVSCNDGAAIAKTEYLVFLNNDTIPNSGWLHALEDYAENNPKAAVVGSKLLYPGNTIQHAGVVICQDRYPRHIYSGFPADHRAVNKSRQFQIVTGACMLVRRAVFEEVGGFDTAFRNGFEDVDLCLRVGAQEHEVHYCAQSVVQHFESVSPNRFKHDHHNVSLYRQRWMDRVAPDDLQYYSADGLLNLSYVGHYPITISFSPMLATMDSAERQPRLEYRLRKLSAHASELSRENVRMRLALMAQAVNSPERTYQKLRQKVCETVSQIAAPGSTILVVSKGDPELLNIPGRKAWHFPQLESGCYAGFHPASGLDAIEALENLRTKGAAYLLIPATYLWWLSFYTEFREHLESHYHRVAAPQDICAIYRLLDRCELTTQREQQITAHTRSLNLSLEVRNLHGNVA